VRAPGLLLAGSLSFLPFAAALASGGSLRIEGATWTGLALLPWIALAGLPRGTAVPREPRSSWLLPLALALPAVGLAVGYERGQDPGRTAVVALGGLLLLTLWALAARLASGSGRGLYGLLWLLLVPGAATAIWALSWAVGGGSATWPQALELALPLPWLASGAERGGEPGAGRLLVGLAGNTAVVLVLCGLLHAKREEGA